MSTQQQQQPPHFEQLFNGNTLTKSKPLSTLYYLYKGNIAKLSLSTLFFLLKQAPVWILPIVTANLINIASKPEDHSLSEIWLNLLLISIVIVQNIPTHSLHVKYMSKAIRFVESGLRSTLVRKLQHLSMAFHGDLKSGRLQSKVLRDVEGIEFLSKQLMVSFLPALFNVIIAVVITVNKSLTVTLFFFLTIPASLLLLSIFRNKIRNTNSEFRKEIEEMSGKVSEMVDMIPITRAHGLEDVEIRKIDNALQNIRGKGYRLDMVEALFGSSNWVVFQMFQVGCLIFTAYLAYRGQIPVGDVVMYQSFFGMILGSVSQILTIYPNVAKGMESIRSVSEILMSQELEEYQGKKKLPNFKGSYQFNNVEFRYRDAETPVLRNFSLDVKAGECIAFVGASGAGKSTLLNMIIGFYKPHQGSVVVDGLPMDELNMQSYRHHLAVVPQTNVLFSGTIRDNITYGLPSVSEEQLNKAIDMANLRELIDQLPKGLDTSVGEHGGKLSGGQRQRIAIARALIRDPQVIILDEATSALDNHSEYQVQKAMKQLIRGRTTFIVAHRLSTIRDADRIVVLKDGVCAEIGSFEELMVRKGVFYQLKQIELPEAL